MNYWRWVPRSMPRGFECWTLVKVEWRYVLFYGLLVLITGCSQRGDLAPVSEVRWHASASSYPGTHRVVRGETLYAIAFKYDTDYRRLAALNHINPPYSLRVGQVIRVQGSHPTPVKMYSRPKVTHPYKPMSRTAAPKVIQTPKNIQYSSNGWYWPVSGRVVASFAPWQGKKGINIACNKSESIRAASSGVVAYAGSGINGYGNLIIMKHHNDYLTAYGNNAVNLVSEGQRVHAGQVIAKAGLIDRKYWGVHFEIRKKGVPMNPLTYLSRGAKV